MAVENIDLPVPGTELAEKPTPTPKPVLVPDPSLPGLAWLRNVKFSSMLGNSHTLAELDDPDVRRRYLDEELNGRNYNAAMVSGMHSRHTYFNHIGRGIQAMGRIADDLHSRGLKLIDHHDATLLWHSDSGLRTLVERLPEMCRGTEDNLPGFQFCPTNPVFKETYYSYLRNLIKAGVDGFQIDELQYWPYGCACVHCREQFHKDTGCQLPMNELDKSIGDVNSPLWKIWLDWRMNSVTNWFVEFRRRNMDIKPDLVLSIYTTHWGFTRSNPRNKACSDLVSLSRAMNLFGTEVMTRNVMQSSRPLIPYRKMKNIITLEHGSPVWGWYYNSDWKTDYFAWAVSNMVGQSSLLSDIKPSPETPPYKEFNGSASNMKREGAQVIAKAALLFSAQSRDWNSVLGFEGELFGLAQTMEDLHIPYEMLGDTALQEKYLSKYSILAIGSSGCLSDDNVADIKKFAEDGGTVYLTTIAGMFDEMGTFRQAWPFQDVFGFGFSPEGSREKLSEVGGVALPGQMIAYASPADTGNPLHVERKYGKGLFIYCSVPVASQFYARECTPPNKWNYNPDMTLYRMFCEELGKVFAGSTVWETNAPSGVYTALWREDDGAVVVHFLNATGTNIKFGEAMAFNAPDPAYPDIATDIQFTIPAANATTAYAASPDYEGDRPLEMKDNGDGTVTVTLPKELIKRYTQVRIK